MIKPKFQYFDGNQWLDDWSSSSQGGVPRAIAISFDFPPVSEFKKPDPPPEDSELEGSGDEMLELENPLFEAQAKSLEGPMQLGGLGERLTESSESEHVIIVETGNRDASPSAMMNSGVPGGQR